MEFALNSLRAQQMLSENVPRIQLDDKLLFEYENYENVSLH